jgi:hypothetical protein
VDPGGDLDTVDDRHRADGTGPERVAAISARGDRRRGRRGRRRSRWLAGFTPGPHQRIPGERPNPACLSYPLGNAPDAFNRVTRTDRVGNNLGDRLLDGFTGLFGIDPLKKR